MVRHTTASFDAMVWTTGHASVLTVPRRYIKDGHVVLGKMYRVTLEEVRA